MREIKFRGFDKTSGEWAYGHYSKVSFGLGFSDAIIAFDGGSTVPTKVDPDSIGQFIGLLDKNGVEIYESDLAKVVVNKHYWVYVIKPLDEFPSAQLYAIQLYNNLGTRIDDDGDEVYDFTISTRGKGSRKELIYERGFEVIGNIYQHPELLKEKENV